MKALLWPIRVFHLTIILYYIVVLPMAISGRLAEHILWNDINFYLTLSILLMQAVWDCPLTKIESHILNEDKKGFIKRILKRYFKINVPVAVFTIIQALAMIAIIISYFVYR